jgi:tetratricopeptide (TPR) repeat protein
VNTARLARRVTPLWIGVVACLGGTDHESLGDQAFAESEFGQALVEYRLALRQSAPDGALRSKAALAALHADDLVAAAEEYQAMAVEASDRATEAADALERVARIALERGDRAALEAALAGAQAIAEGRALGQFARELAKGFGEAPRSPDALPVLLVAAAAAPDAAQQDSLMFVYASVLRRLGRCAPAVEVFESLIRRRRNPSLVEDARTGGAACALRIGRIEQERGFPEEAAQWFVRAAAVGGDNALGREGFVLLGDVRLALGQYADALAAYERAILGMRVTDSLYVVVVDRINAIANAGTVFR